MKPESKTITDLRGRLNDAEHREVVLKGEQADISFDAFAGGKAKARARYDEISNELVKVDAEKRGIETALQEAARRDEAAAAAEIDVKRREGAFEVEAMLPDFIDDAKEFDQALAKVVAIATRLDRNFAKARALVNGGPERFSIAANTVRALQTATMGGVLHFFHLPPGERTDLTRCVGSWVHQLKVAIGRIVGANAEKSEAA